MDSVLDKQLVRALDLRLAVFQSKADNLLTDEMQLRAVAYLISELLLPCCCMLCNKQKLEILLSKTRLCNGSSALTAKLAVLVYDDLARCNGLG